MLGDSGRGDTGAAGEFGRGGRGFRLRQKDGSGAAQDSGDRIETRYRAVLPQRADASGRVGAIKIRG
ncbi:hypothetical protein Misp02_30530 [Microtetraspora sp. NBRC 16547]|nr:hypothetical protein Misp02_30530 [Microtetraspora sp. NBRC 16547]